jgi:DNA-binding MarR family transcriptional regulator
VRAMGNNSLDNIVENLLYILPVFHKKFLKIDISDLCRDIHMSRLHLAILETIYHEKAPISEVAKKFLISKPQMTHLVNQLVTAKMVEKKNNPKDRRVTDVTLTEKGLKTMKQCDEFLKKNLKCQLSFLNQDDQDALALSIQKIRDICFKWYTPN